MSPFWSSFVRFHLSKYLVGAVLLCFFSVTAFAAEPNKEEKFNVREMLFEHIIDSHEWHITDIPLGLNADGSRHYRPVQLELPYIVYNSQRGLEVFSLNGGSREARIAEAAARGYALNSHNNLAALTKGVTVIDFSLTKTVIQMLLIAFTVALVFIGVARSFKHNVNQAPRGVQSLFEPLIIFIRDEVAKPNLHGKHYKYLPYLLSLFFFVFFANVLGLIPINSNIAGSISVTLALALLTFIIVQFSGSKDYWLHIFWFPGVSIVMKFFMVIIELVGLVTKPFALTIRLFANIAAGHFMVLSLVALIFILNSTKGFGAAVGIMPISILFSIVIMLLEVLVAIIQAYIFTMLTAVFIGQALESHTSHNNGHEGIDGPVAVEAGAF